MSALLSDTGVEVQLKLLYSPSTNKELISPYGVKSWLYWQWWEGWHWFHWSQVSESEAKEAEAEPSNLEHPTLLPWFRVWDALVLRRTEGMGINTQNHCHGAMRGSVSRAQRFSDEPQTSWEHRQQIQSPGGPGGLPWHGRGRKLNTFCWTGIQWSSKYCSPQPQKKPQGLMKGGI